MIVRESARHEAAALLACDPSWAEAMAKATEVLRGFDPEIARAREQNAQKERQVATMAAINNIVRCGRGRFVM